MLPVLNNYNNDIGTIIVLTKCWLNLYLFTNSEHMHRQITFYHFVIQYWLSD